MRGGVLWALSAAWGMAAACGPATAPLAPTPVRPAGSVPAPQTPSGPAHSAPPPAESAPPEPPDLSESGEADGPPGGDPSPAVPVEPSAVTLPAGARRLGTPVVSARFQGWIVSRLIFSPDGAHLAVASEPIGDARIVVRVFAVATGRETMALRSAHAASGLAFSPDGRRLATVGVGTTPAAVYDPADGRHLADLAGTGGPPAMDWRVGVSVTFSVDGQQIFTDNGTAVTRSALDGSLRGRHGTAWLTNPNIVPMINGHVLFRQHVRGGQWVSGLDVHDAATGRPLRTFDPGSAVWFALADLAPRLAVARTDGVVQVWDCATGEPGTPLPMAERVTRLALDPAGTVLVAVTGDDSLTGWSAADGRSFLEVPQSAFDVREVAIASGGRHVAAALPDGTVALWTPADQPK